MKLLEKMFDFSVSLADHLSNFSVVCDDIQTVRNQQLGSSLTLCNVLLFIENTLRFYDFVIRKRTKKHEYRNFLAKKTHRETLTPVRKTATS